MNKTAWLIHTDNKSVKRFRTFPNPEYFNDYKTEIITGELLPGEHPLLKTRTVMRREEAVKLWKELVKGGWRRTEPQW